ncbi:hypothetical protein [Xanthomonas phage Suba]|uniref:Uncharacterized protein n=1 Tax=Xanthomonas phage Suba TaxID=2674975 RepID=A0A679KKJ5_9CAUD|nr:hypothetical protein QAY88_gp45 [Xanthomonas phage Suba]CAA2409861.1 hypothetical protein [Xanthomonas phage Suba]
MDKFEQEGYDAFVEALCNMPKHAMPSFSHAHNLLPGNYLQGSEERQGWVRGWLKAREEA